MTKHRCEGKRGTFGVHKCGRKATGTITTNVGISEILHQMGVIR